MHYSTNLKMRKGSSEHQSETGRKEDDKGGKNTYLTLQAAFGNHFIENPK